MHLKIAQKLVKGGVLSDDATNAVGVAVAWVEIDGVRYNEVLAATVEISNTAMTVATLRIAAATEVVLLGPDMNEIDTRDLV